MSNAALASIGSHDSAARAGLLAVLASELTFSVGLEQRREDRTPGKALARAEAGTLQMLRDGAVSGVGYWFLVVDRLAPRKLPRRSAA